MNNFKVGDWVRHKTIKNEIVKVKNSGNRNNFVEVIDPSQLHWEVTRQYDINSLELWQPKVGEWCWFWNNENDLTLQKFWKTEQNYFIVAFCEKHKNDEFIFYDITDKHFKNCEPFIGELPSFIKDK